MATKQTTPVMVTQLNAKVGLKVVRGRDWSQSDQDGGKGNIGTITEVNNWVTVKWDKSKTSYGYRIDKVYDLYITGSVKKLTEAFGWTVTKKGTQTFAFGCGAVEVTKAEMKTYLKLESMFVERGVKNRPRAKQIMEQLINQ